MDTAPSSPAYMDICDCNHGNDFPSTGTPAPCGLQHACPRPTQHVCGSSKVWMRHNRAMPVAVAKVLDHSCREVCGMSADRCSNAGGFALLGIGGANPNADNCYNRSTLLHRTDMHSYTNNTQPTHQSTIRIRPAVFDSILGPAVFNCILVSLPDLG